MTNEEHIIACAVRYGLGRRTYITLVISEYVLSKIKELSEHCKSVIIKDIKQAQDDEMMGDSCDKSNWINLLLSLENSMINRKYTNG